MGVNRIQVQLDLVRKVMSRISLSCFPPDWFPSQAGPAHVVAFGSSRLVCSQLSNSSRKTKSSFPPQSPAKAWDRLWQGKLQSKLWPGLGWVAGRTAADWPRAGLCCGLRRSFCSMFSAFAYDPCLALLSLPQFMGAHALIFFLLGQLIYY